MNPKNTQRKKDTNMKNHSTLVTTLIILLPCWLLLSQDPGYAAISNRSVQEFEAIVDALVQPAVDDHSVAGATVAVVKDGTRFFMKGYGFAEIEHQIPVHAEITAFNIASVSKVFTATAAMQMVEQGKLSLDEDVNSYLTGFHTDTPFATPLTLRHLLTHTTGFDEKDVVYYKSRGERFYDSVEPLDEYLRHYLPPVVKEPGTYWQYSTYGMTLAGYLVENASGMPFQQYVTEHILQPLSMKHSSYWLTPNILPTAATPYTYRRGQYQEGAHTLLSNHPSGAMYASASDMANFLIMQLNNGEFHGQSILNAANVQSMHTPQYSAGDHLLWVGFGFLGNMRHGAVTLEHGGYLPGFHSFISMMPERNLGLFISLTSATFAGGRVKRDFAAACYDFFLSPESDDVVTSELPRTVPLDMEVNSIAGRYAAESFSYHGLSKLKAVLMPYKLSFTPDDHLTVRVRGTNTQYSYIGDGYFYSAQDKSYCRISENNGTMVFAEAYGMHEKIPVSWTILFYGFLAGLPVFFITGIVQSVSILKHWASQERWAFIGKFLVLALCGLMLVYTLCYALYAVKSMNADTEMAIHIIRPLITLLWYGSLLTTVLTGFFVGYVWKIRMFSLKARIWYTLVICFGAVAVTFMAVMNGM
jgi:CubicO group peptidase (beta-lactamase class C family)